MLSASEFDVHASDAARQRATQAVVSDPSDVERGRLTWGPSERAAVDTMRGVMRAMSLNDAAGGFAVRCSLDPTFVMANPGSVNPIRELARVGTISTDRWNGVRTAGSSVSWMPEAAEVGDNSPTLTQPSVLVFKGAEFVPTRSRSAWTRRTSWSRSHGCCSTLVTNSGPSGSSGCAPSAPKSITTMRAFTLSLALDMRFPGSHGTHPTPVLTGVQPVFESLELSVHI